MAPIEAALGCALISLEKNLQGVLTVLVLCFVQKGVSIMDRVYMGSKWVCSSLNVTTKLELDLQQAREKQTQPYLSCHPCQAAFD